VGIVALMCNLLECTSTTATSLNEALELVKTQTFDLIITDYYLPPDNALILLHEVRHLRPGLPAILMTEDPRIADLTRSFSLNIVETLIKPFSRSALEKALAKVWARKNPQ
jgi:CheY-like chemotaxis protein